MNLNFMLSRCLKKCRPAIINTACVFLLLLSAASCRKENSASVQYPIPSGLKLVSSGYAAGASTRVEIYAYQDLYVGYDRLSIALYDSASNARITQAQVSLATVTGAGVAAPTENPSGSSAVNGLFDGAAVLVSTGSTALTVQVQNFSNSRTGSYSAPVNVVQTSPAKSYSVTTADNAKLFVSIVQPTNPQLGVNTFELVVDRQVNSTNYAPDSTYMLAINPTMPSMTGMGSPNNVNPVYTGNGHYAGKVDFIMSGGWQIYVDLLHNGAVADSTHYFDLNL